MRDPFKAALYTGECPDVIGWRDGHSVLLEIKTSRADFLADRKKVFRKSPELGMGDARLFLAPRGVIGVADLPEGWGLLVTDGKRIKIESGYQREYELGSWSLNPKRKSVSWYPYPFEGNKRCETVMLVSALARNADTKGH